MRRWGWRRPVAIKRYGRLVTRDEAIRIGVFTLGRWHRSDHGDRCVCLEGEQFGAQSGAVIDALVVEGFEFDAYSGTDRGPLGPPGAPRSRRRGMILLPPLDRWSSGRGEIVDEPSGMWSTRRGGKPLTFVQRASLKNCSNDDSNAARFLRTVVNGREQ